jgi:hypothetical protein
VDATVVTALISPIVIEFSLLARIQLGHRRPEGQSGT